MEGISAQTADTSKPNPDLEFRVIDVLRSCYDPEIPVNIYELGLIYTVEIDGSNNVTIRMTLTSPMCPVAGTLPGEVEQKVQSIQGVNSVRVDLVWDPAWNPSMMTEAAKLQLGFL
ncbi:MAG TPA: SUF system Fe-S cluster assembly protein [Terriglobia bacterium]|nr:SUF system Fe-S cluster assembly protein [Terriglobia bacterium]